MSTAVQPAAVPLDEGPPFAPTSAERARSVLGPRGSVTGTWRLSGARLVCVGNFVVELPNGHLTDVHRTTDRDSLEEVLAEVRETALELCRAEAHV